MLWAFRAHARAKVPWRMSLVTFDQHAVTPHLTDTNTASAAALGEPPLISIYCMLQYPPLLSVQQAIHHSMMHKLRGCVKRCVMLDVQHSVTQPRGAEYQMQAWQGPSSWRAATCTQQAWTWTPQHCPAWTSSCAWPPAVGSMRQPSVQGGHMRCVSFLLSPACRASASCTMRGPASYRAAPRHAPCSSKLATRYVEAHAETSGCKLVIIIWPQARQYVLR